jgi:hypothetical protein
MVSVAGGVGGVGAGGKRHIRIIGGASIGINDQGNPGLRAGQTLDVRQSGVHRSHGGLQRMGRPELSVISGASLRQREQRKQGTDAGQTGAMHGASSGARRRVRRDLVVVVVGVCVTITNEGSLLGNP